MPNKMLIDATHPEETRVVVLRGNRVEEFDFESASRRQLRGNIYLAKVTRVEPSLQAAFVDYGGNRHGFLAFSEIHPDYYQIPVADRQALIDEEERAHRDAEAEADRRAGMRRRPRHRPAAHNVETIASEPTDAAGGDDHPDRHEFEAGAETAAEAGAGDAGHRADVEHDDHHGHERQEHERQEHERQEHEHQEHEHQEHAHPTHEHHAHASHESHAGNEDEGPPAQSGESREPDAPDREAATALSGEPEDGDQETEDERHADSRDPASRDNGGSDNDDGGENGEGEEEEIVESVGGADAMEEVPDRSPRHRRQYKIQEVIKRRQVMLVQVVKEERGTKGAALTTYLSLAGRYSVLMPNTARGGGISRKITAIQDRKRLKEIAGELEVPEGMGVILRTAGASRTKTEIKRDFEYLLRAWETVRDLTLNSTAPTLVYEEGSLVKRSIRDLYNKDIDEVIVAGDAAYRDARDFMRMLMPSHAKNVKPYHDNQPVLARYGIESQLDAMFSPVVQLRSGGYIVLNQTEALVAIDVNSGRATREHHIEDTALKTNLEASEEIARQLRLRDLAGLIVIDFIDMDEKRNNRSVERRLKECLKNDRARIQVGRISHFGLLEMSRQRIRTSVLESSTDKCPHCGGTGHVRSVSSVALQCLRMIEESLQRGATHNLTVRTRSDIALYVLNHKRTHLYELEKRYQITITVSADPGISGQQPFVVEKGELVHSLEQARALAAQSSIVVATAPEDDDFEIPIEEEAEVETATVEADEEADALEEESGEGGEAAERGENGEGGRRRRRRRRRGRGTPRQEGGVSSIVPDGVGGVVEALEPGGADDEPDEPSDAEETIAAEGAPHAVPGQGNGNGNGNGNGDGERRRRRRGRRGGRRNRREEGEGGMLPPEHGVAPIDEEVMTAVADFGAAPAEQIAHSDSPAQEEAPPVQAEAPAPRARPAAAPAAPEPAPAASPSAPSAGEPPPAKEPPRRRSTVREPVRFPVGEVPMPVPGPAPVAAEPAILHRPAPEPAAAGAESAASAPRRAGWWAKRIFGEKE
ncbi:MAG TPA: Rne/Rng family ribonuclease [Xanthobacteraceae bacterium]|jgi:ribonuclease E|nr:Rne/Rng family ribonuclease [Xanthobacteraceae bacterium]